MLAFLTFCFLGCGEDREANDWSGTWTPPPESDTPKEPPPKQESDIPKEPPLKLVEFVKPIADGDFTVAAGDFQAFKFEVTDDMVNPTVDGKFEVLVGGTIKVMIFDEINHINWRAGVKGVKAWHWAGNVAAGKIENLGRFPPGTHYLVLDNTFSWFTKKKVQVKVELKCSKWM
ncbi:MAG: hypothetical protein H8D67_29720 [Deltaproteobacteria bacterium]|nr:hypothetical protein [Deltaproteobacteria bacterium]